MPLKLEVFDLEVKSTKDPVLVTSTGAVEEAKLNAYEQGYAAGWEDCANAQTEAKTAIQEDFGRNLRNLSFTYNEARMHVLRSIEPLLHEMTSRLLPEMAREALAPVVLETLMPMVEELADAPIHLVVNPVVRQSIEALLDQATGMPLIIREEPSLPAGQVYLRLGDTEAKVDLDQATQNITAAVRSFFGLSEQGKPNE